MKKRFICMSLFLSALLLEPAILSGSSEGPDARILFINSYHRGYSWSDGIERGYRSRIENSGRNIEISYEYLDSHRFVYGAQIEPIARSMEVKYATLRPDVVVASDNAAFDFAVRYRQRLFPDQPVVFCGYNNFRPGSAAGISNITGVNEEASIADTVSMALKLRPGTSTMVFVISSGNISTRFIAEDIKTTVYQRYKKNYSVVLAEDASPEEFRREMEKLPGETLVFICGPLRCFNNGKAITPEESGRLVSSISPFPVFTCWDYDIGNGVLGGHIVSGPDQGKEAADLSLKILDGSLADEIPVVMKSPARDVFDYSVMKRFQISSRSLPLRAVIINRPFSIWRSYFWQIIGIVFLVGMETALIVILMKSTAERRRINCELDRERAMLEKHVSERTSELRDANEKLALLSITDSLTGLANRRHFDEVLEREFMRLERSGSRLSLIMMDIDHFKDYNDTHGHVAGDECLRSLGRLIMESVNRISDLPARYGGEEFAIILPETDEAGAVTLAERIRESIEHFHADNENTSLTGNVTASFGVVTVPAGTLRDSTELVRLADGELYRAKASGRNRVFSVVL